MKKYLLALLLFIACTILIAANSIQTPSVKYGKYSCTASKYRNGSYEFVGRGSITLAPNKNYSYSGFEKPSSGSFTIDKSGTLFFKGGFLNGGKAERIGTEHRYYLVFPSNPDNRWTCSLIK